MIRIENGKVRGLRPGDAVVINNRVWFFEKGRNSPGRWATPDCMHTIGLSTKDPEFPYTVFNVNYRTIEAAARYALKRHKSDLRKARKVVAKWGK